MSDGLNHFCGWRIVVWGCLGTALACGPADPAIEQAGEILSAPACAAGTRADAGTLTCVSVGTTTTPDGFELLAGGWGFAAILPEAVCEGATRAALGSRTCEVLDEVAETFPPAAASVLVRANGASDGSTVPVVSTLAEAVALAQPGATIAIDEGTYASCPLPKAVTLVGHGASRTTLAGGDMIFVLDTGAKLRFQSLALAGGAKAALIVNKRTSLEMDRVYVRAAQSAIQIGNGASVAAVDTVLEGPLVPARQGAPCGALVSYGGRLSFTNSEMRRFQTSVSAQSEMSRVAITHSVLHDENITVSESEAASVVSAFTGVNLQISASYIESKRGRIGIVGAAMLDGSKDLTSPSNPPATITIVDSALVQRDASRPNGSGFDAFSGANISLLNSTVQHQSFAGVAASESGRLSLRNSVILANTRSLDSQSAVILTSHADAQLVDTVFVNSVGSGATFLGGSTGHFDGFLVVNSRDDGEGGRAISVTDGSNVTLSHGSIVQAEDTAIGVEAGSLGIDHVVIADGRASSFKPFRAAIVARDAIVLVRDSVLKGNGVGLALSGGRTLLQRSAVTDHQEAVRMTPTMNFDETVDPNAVAIDGALVAAQTAFRRNATTLNRTLVIAE